MGFKKKILISGDGLTACQGDDVFQTIRYNSPVQQPGWNSSFELDLLLVDGNIVKGSYRRHDLRELSISKSSRSNEGFFFDGKGDKIEGVVGFRETDVKV